MPTREFWAANMERLKELRAEGYTAARIAAMLGVTRNAVSGQMSRHGVAAPTAVRRKISVTPSKPAPLRVIPSEPAPVGPLRDFPKSGTCRFIHGDVKDDPWRCCGHPSVGALSPWCEHHLGRVSGASPHRRLAIEPQPSNPTLALIRRDKTDRETSYGIGGRKKRDRASITLPKLKCLGGRR
jgi:hypothetical protein